MMSFLGFSMGGYDFRVTDDIDGISYDIWPDFIDDCVQVGSIQGAKKGLVVQLLRDGGQISDGDMISKTQVMNYK
jgi:hypothetical protein